MLIGMGTPIQTLPISAAALREIDLVGVFRYANTYQEGINILQTNAIPSIEKLVTHKFWGLGEGAKAFRMAGKQIDDDGKLVLKVVIDTSGTVDKANL